MNKVAKYSIAALLILSVAACATQPGQPINDLPGFFSGLWHGAIAPFAFIGGLLVDVRMYAFPNSGSWYDFGFLIGLSVVWGGGGTVVYRR